MSDFLKQVQDEIKMGLDYVSTKRQIIRNRLIKYIDQDKDQDKIGVNTIYSIMQLWLAIRYSDETSVIVMPRKFWDEEYADNLTDLAKYDFDEMWLKVLNYQRDWDMQFTWVGIRRNRWRDDIKWVPVTDVADPLTWIPDPYGNFYNPFRFHYFEVEILKSEMTEERWFDESIVNDLTPAKLQERQTNESYRDDATGLQTPSEDTSQDFYISCYDGYTYENGKLYIVTVTGNMQEILRKVEVKPVTKEEKKSKRIDMRTQVNLTWFSPTRDCFWVSLLDLIEDKQTANSILANLRLIDAKFSTFGQMNLVNTDMVKNTADLLKPSINTKWIGVNAGNNSLSNAVYPVPRQNIMADSYNVSAELSRQIQLDTGISENTLWVPTTKNMTLWESQQIQANANIRLALWISVSNWWEEDFWKYIWLRAYEEYMEDSQTKFARVASWFDTIWIEFRRDDFIGWESPDIKIESKKVADQKREKMKTDFLTMLPYFIQNPEVPRIVKDQAMRFALKLQWLPREQIKLLTFNKDEQGAKDKLVLINNDDIDGAKIEDMNEDHLSYLVIFEQAIDNSTKEKAIRARKDALVRSGQLNMQQSQGMEQSQGGMLNAMQSQMTSAAIWQNAKTPQNVWNISQNV